MADPDDDLAEPDPRWAADLRAQLLAAAQRQVEGPDTCGRTRRPVRPVPR
jgi:hypothetical protein